MCNYFKAKLKQVRKDLIYMSVKERLIEYLKFKGISKTDFGRSIGVSSAYVTSIRKSIDPEKIQSIALKYPDLNMEWLIAGQGEMLKSSTSTAEQPSKSLSRGVPYYNIDFLGGFDLIFNDSSTVPEYLIDFREFNRATCWCNITGHSMEPEINHGDIIALREIPDLSFIPYGEIYAIVTTTGMRTVKRIGPSSKPDCYSLIPTNKSPEYGIQEIPKSAICRIYEVLGCMKKI